MKICEKCGTLMILQKEDNKLYFVCKKCKIKIEMKKSNCILKQTIKKQKPLILKNNENIEQLPKTKKKCEKCGNNEVYWWSRQTRASDEPETRFYRCTKCRQTWREYS
ncbi:MAG: transcription factor S [Candidatus Aenigmarchaeota archaeon ex4484_52]|nr:MAG: transcription factor S [Candidatus Aenigmarchaeota archaeon ex4484_52]